MLRIADSSRGNITSSTSRDGTLIASLYESTGLLWTKLTTKVFKDIQLEMKVFQFFCQSHRYTRIKRKTRALTAGVEPYDSGTSDAFPLSYGRLVVASN